MDEMGVKPLPGNMGETLDNLEKDEVILNAMGEDLSRSYLAVKKTEYETLKNLPSAKEVELLLEKY
jgi:glutamine synthetase